MYLDELQILFSGKKNKMDERELSDRDSVSLDDKEYENVEKEEKATPFKGHLYVNVQIPVRGQHTKSGSIETRKQKQVGSKN